MDMASRDLILTNISVKLVDRISDSPPKRQKLGYSLPLLAFYNSPHLISMGSRRHIHETRADNLEDHRRTYRLADP